MQKFIMMNEWSFSGEIFYLKELEKDYGASLKIRGTATRKDNSFRSDICELGCLVTRDAWNEAKKKGVKVYKNIAVSGHLETFIKNDGNSKIMFIAEYIMEVA